MYFNVMYIIKDIMAKKFIEYWCYVAYGILFLELIGLAWWLFSLIPIFVVDKVWRASHILIGFHSILPITLYLIQETYFKQLKEKEKKEEKKIESLFWQYPLVIVISYLFVIGTDTTHLFGIVSEYDELYVHAQANNRSRSIYILELSIASYYSFLNAITVTWTVIFACLTKS